MDGDAAVRDSFGNELLGMCREPEERLPALAAAVPMPASLVVVRHGGAVLLVLESWRKQWELPGGGVEPGETWREAARRELREETGIDTDALDLALVADFALTGPRRRELAAVYAVRLDAPPALRLNPEVDGFLWWRPDEDPPPTSSPLDLAIARQVGV